MEDVQNLHQMQYHNARLVPSRNGQVFHLGPERAYISVERVIWVVRRMMYEESDR